MCRRRSLGVNISAVKAREGCIVQRMPAARCQEQVVVETMVAAVVLRIVRVQPGQFRAVSPVERRGAVVVAIAVNRSLNEIVNHRHALGIEHQ